MIEKPVQEAKKELLIAALKKHAGNRTRAAKELKISIRTCREWMIKFGLRDEFPAIEGRRKFDL